MPENGRKNRKYACNLLILLRQNSSGSQEVVSSILTSSTNKINNLQNHIKIKLPPGFHWGSNCLRQSGASLNSCLDIIPEESAS